MSESAGAPSGVPAQGGQPASTPAPAPSGPEPGSITGPPPSSQPSISVSEAARMLARQRREGGAQGGQQGAPAPNGAAAPPPAAPNGAAPAAPAPAATPSGVAAMAEALGLPPEVTGAPAADAGPAVEFDGRRYSTAELREAVSKATDYTRKTQELAERNRNLQAQQEALATVLPYIQPELARLAEAVQNAPARPDPRLLDIDPNRYHRERAEFERGLEEQQRLASLTQLQQQAQQRAMEQQVAAGNEVLAREFPFWADPAQRLEAQQQIVQWALSKGGYTQQELQGLTNPAQLKAMMKAAMFDRWVEQAKTSAPPNGVYPVRGQTPPPAPSERVQQAQSAFDAKPDWRNAAALLAARRKNGA